MAQFHTDEYVDFLSRIAPDNSDAYGREQAKCPSSHGPARTRQSTSATTVRSSMACSSTARSPQAVQWVRADSRPTLTHAEGAARLSRDKCDIAVNWAGGLHHAKKGSASGFCYINGEKIAAR